MATAIRRRFFETDERTSMGLVVGGSIAESVASGAAVAATIAGLAGVVPMLAASAAVIAIGTGLLFEGGAIGARFAGTLRERESDSFTTGDVAGALTGEILAGVIGIVLGVLAFLGVAPLALLSTSALVYACGLLVGSGALAHTMFTVREGAPLPSSKRDILLAAASGQLFVGLGAAVLSIVALFGTYPLTLTLVSLLLIAGSELLSGVALGSKTARMMRA